jgi:hypothetical protein
MAVRRRRVPRFAGLVVSFATLAAVAVGCASGIVSRGHIQPDRLEEVQVRTERARGMRTAWSQSGSGPWIAT